MSSLYLRAATLADAARLLAWRNDEGTLASLRGHQRVDAETHGAWLRAALIDQNVLLWIAEIGGVPVGVARLNRSTTRLLCSIIVAPEHRGKHLARPLIEAMCAWRFVGADVIDAEILQSNAASQRAFFSAGFSFEQALGAGEDAIVVMRWRS